MSYEYKTEPFDHQRSIFEASRDKEAHALFLEMGTGKSKIVIDNAAYLYLGGQIDTLLILAPKAVAPNWVADELPAHMPDVIASGMTVFLWSSEKANGKRYQKELKEFLSVTEGLRVLVMSYDAIMTQKTNNTPRGYYKGKEAAQKFLKSNQCMMVLDESARIKTPGAKRTKRIVAAGRYAKYRRILTGTPVANSPFDVFSQLQFLDPGIWSAIGCRSFASFKASFGIWIEHTRNDNGRAFKKLVDYKNLPALNKVVDACGDRVLKEDVLDLPPITYSKRHFDLIPEQKKLYAKIRDEFMVWLAGGDMITAPLAITRLLRMQQVTSGYCPTDDGQTVRIAPNPRMACLMDTLDDIPHQTIVWAKFQDDIDRISQELDDRKISYVVYDGRVNTTDRETRRAAFKAGEAKIFLANASTAGEGLTLVTAKTMIYYNTTYKLADRLQSEARFHRIGQTDPVTVIDIIASGTVDEKIIDALRSKVDIAAQVTGDRYKEWI